MCRPSRPKPIAVVGERRVEGGLQHLQHRLLDEAVESGGHAQFAHATIRLGNLDTPDRRRRIGAVQQLVPMLWPVRPQVVRELLDGHPVDARAPLVRLDATQRLLQVVSLTHCLHQRANDCRAFGLALRHHRFGISSGGGRLRVLRREEDQPELFGQPLFGHESRVLSATPFIPLRGPFRPSVPFRLGLSVAPPFGSGVPH